jgi:uncharacterized protein YjiS (DUF1127 family)
MTHATHFDGALAPTWTAQGWFARARKALEDRARYRHTLAELNALTDRDLKDLGMSRLDIAHFAREAVYGA